MASKCPYQFSLHLHPKRGGLFTQWRLYGSVETTVAENQVCRLVSLVSAWSGWPVELVLPVDVGTDAWFEWWADIVTGIPADRLRVRFTLKGKRPIHRTNPQKPAGRQSEPMAEE